MNIIQTNKAPQPVGSYSQALVVNGFIFCSGQLGIDPATNTLASDVEAQAHQVMKNIEQVLLAAGSDLNHIVKATIFLVNVSDFAKVNEIYGKYLRDNKPARSTVEVSRLPQGKFANPPLIEIEAIAVLP